MARSSKSMDRPLKAGWLKKQQRGLVKNWQQRYFVLRGTTLTYHKDKETAVQVSSSVHTHTRTHTHHMIVHLKTSESPGGNVFSPVFAAIHQN